MLQKHVFTFVNKPSNHEVSLSADTEFKRGKRENYVRPQRTKIGVLLYESLIKLPAWSFFWLV